MTAWRAASGSAAERGSAALPFAIALPVIIGFMGLALDLAQVYGRHTELQQVADSAALAAARQLNGTDNGVEAALAAAEDVVDEMRYALGKEIVWDDAALSFSNSADGPWTSSANVNSDATAAGLAFARIDTAVLRGDGDAGAIGVITMFFPHAGVTGGGLDLKAGAVAGPASGRVTPLAICALDTNPAGSRAHPPLAAERIEYGFRRGVSYNLLDLSPNSTTAQAYLVNPIDPADQASVVTHFDDAVVRQFFCSGTVALTDLSGGVHVRALGATPIHTWLNSRFNDAPATTGCVAATAPPDNNIREYTGAGGSYTDWYMADAHPTGAASAVDRTTSRVTYADLDDETDTVSAPLSAAAFGPLWTYSRPRTVNGNTYNLADWDVLYQYQGVNVPDPTTAQALKYGNGDGVYRVTKHTTKPSTGASTTPNFRRVLNIPLLNCSVASPGTPGVPAQVLGIGEFFMTARAAAGQVPGEFAGVIAPGIPSNSVALYK